MGLGEVVSFLLFAAMGKLLMFLFQKFPLAKILMERKKFFYELISCDLCLGVWFYFFLAIIIGINILPFYIPILSYFVTGCITSFLVHLVSLGWSVKFSTYEVS